MKCCFQIVNKFHRYGIRSTDSQVFFIVLHYGDIIHRDRSMHDLELGCNICLDITQRRCFCTVSIGLKHALYLILGDIDGSNFNDRIHYHCENKSKDNERYFRTARLIIRIQKFHTHA